MARPRLYERLDAASHRPVTLLTAQAGRGRTVLTSSWIRQAAVPAAWLSVEPGDDDRFWPYLHASATGALDRNGRDLPALPASSPGPSAAFLTRFADALGHLSRPLILVVDDADHLHDTAVLNGLGFLLRHAGERLRLVLTTRAEPALSLHRWRLSGELTELGTGELSFTDTEAAELFARHGLLLPDARLAERRPVPGTGHGVGPAGAGGRRVRPGRVGG